MNSTLIKTIAVLACSAACITGLIMQQLSVGIILTKCNRLPSETLKMHVTDTLCSNQSI